MKKIIPTLFYTILIIVFVSCSNHDGKSNHATAVPVRIVQAKKIRLSNRVVLPGLIITSDQAVIASHTNGRVTKINVIAGQRVAQGDLLIEVDPATSRAALAQNNAQYQAALLEAQQAERDFERCKVLYAQKAASRHEYEINKNNYETTQAKLTAAKLALSAARNNLEYVEIHAPFAGIIARKDVNVGDYVSPGTIFFILAGGNAQAITNVSDDIFQLIKLGDQIEIEVNGVTQNATVIERVMPADPSSHTHQIKLQFSKTAAVNSGAYANIYFTIGYREALSVPRTAVVKRAGLQGVFIVKPDDTADYHIVSVGPTSNGFTEILAGLVPGMKVIDKPGSEIENGTLVEPKQ